MSRITPSLLLLIPVDNEEDRIEPMLRSHAEYFKKNDNGKFQSGELKPPFRKTRPNHNHGNEGH